MKDLESAKSDKSPLHSPSTRQTRGFRHILENFSPQWFVLNMGSGITSLLLYQFPYSASWLYWLSVVIFALHTFLACLFTALSVLRYTMCPGLLWAMLSHPVEACYLGAHPVSLLSLSTLIASICGPAWGPWAITTAWILWIVASAFGAIVSIYVPWMHIHHTHRSSSQQHPLSQITAVYLLPHISAIVAATTGATVASALSSSKPDRAAATVIASYGSLGLGLSTALCVMVLYLARLLLYQLPPREVVMSGFVAIGPLNMGAVAWLMLGTVTRAVFPKANDGAGGGLITANAGETLYTLGILAAMLLWGFGLLWLWFALGGVWVYGFKNSMTGDADGDGEETNETNITTNPPTPTTTKSQRIPFSLSYWSLVFPIGTFALSSAGLGKALPSSVFRVLAAILSVLVALLFLGNLVMTAWDVLGNKGRKVLVSPAAEQWREKKRRKEMRRREEKVMGNGRARERERERQESNETEMDTTTLSGVETAESGGSAATRRRKEGGAGDDEEK